MRGCFYHFVVDFCKCCLNLGWEKRKGEGKKMGTKQKEEKEMSEQKEKKNK